jgi:hypothetical protein
LDENPENRSLLLPSHTREKYTSRPFALGQCGMQTF